MINVRSIVAFTFALSLCLGWSGMMPRSGANAAPDDKSLCSMLAQKVEKFEAAIAHATDKTEKLKLLADLNKIREEQKAARCPVSGIDEKTCAMLEQKVEKFEAAIAHATDKAQKLKLITELNKLRDEQKAAKCSGEIDTLKSGSGEKLTCAALEQKVEKFEAAIKLATDKAQKLKFIAELNKLREEQKVAGCAT